MSTSLTRIETPPQALARILNAGKRQLEIALGEAMDPNRMIRLAVTALHQSPDLCECDMVSIANSVMLAAQLRLEVNTSLGHAWLIPYAKVCTLQVGYRGLIELAHRSPEVHDVSAHVVWAADKFEIEYGDAPRCVHKPFTGGSRERGARLGAYAVIRYKNGSPNFLYMNGDDIEDIRDKSSKSKNSEHSPWKRFPDEMWRKTAAKRLLKYCRLSIEDLSRAIGLDDQADAAEVPQNGQRADTVSQELALDAPLLDLAEQATHELRGSVERQERVAEEKIAEMQSKQAPVTGAASGTYRDLTDEENKALDKAIVEQEKRKEQAQPAQPVRRKLF